MRCTCWLKQYTNARGRFSVSFKMWHWWGKRNLFDIIRRVSRLYESLNLVHISLHIFVEFICLAAKYKSHVTWYLIIPQKNVVLMEVAAFKAKSLINFNFCGLSINLRDDYESMMRFRKRILIFKYTLGKMRRKFPPSHKDGIKKARLEYKIYVVDGSAVKNWNVFNYFYVGKCWEGVMKYWCRLMYEREKFHLQRGKDF